jgi:hypothetical protein
MKPLSPEGATAITGIVSLMFSATMFQAYCASGGLWIFAVLIALYLGGSVGRCACN